MDFGLGTRGGFALVTLVGVVVPGVANYVLSQVGFDPLGSLVWALGYGAMAVVLWLGWVRPLDLTGPDDTIRQPEEGDAAGGGTDTDGTGGEPEPADAK